MKNILTPGMNGLLNNFYRNSTIYVPNKYSVILYGPAVRNAMSVLRKSSEATRTDVKNPINGDGATGHRPIDLESFKRWEHYHYHKSFFKEYSGYPFSNKTKSINGAVHLKWACNNVNIPTLDSQEADDKEITMDTFKNIKFHIVGDADANKALTLSVTEEKGMMWYQFFNALGNQFFNAKALIPRDSLHKLSALVVPLISSEDDDITSRMKFEKGQIFEFNSIIYTGMGNTLKFSNDTETPLTYNVSFTCPNSFQQTFKKEEKGMLNRAHDDNYLSSGSSSIKPRHFEDIGNVLDSWD